MSAALALSRDATSSSRQCCLDLAFYLVEIALARRRNAGHVVPDIAAIGLERIVVDADVGRERGVDHFGGVGKVFDRLAVGVAAGAVDGVVGDDRQLQFLRRVLERCAAGAGVLDLVVDVLDDFLDARQGDLVADLRRHVGEGFAFLGDDLRHGDDDHAEPALHRRAHFAVLERKGGVRHGRIDDGRFRHRPEIEVLLLEPALGRERRERQAALDARAGGFRLGHGGKRHLLDVAALRRDVAVAVGVKNPFDVLVRDLGGLGELRRRRHHGRDFAEFRRAEQDFARIEIFAELFRGRRRNVAGLRRTERQIVDAARLVLELIERVEPGARQRDIARDRIDDLPA